MPTTNESILNYTTQIQESLNARHQTLDESSAGAFSWDNLYPEFKSKDYVIGEWREKESAQVTSSTSPPQSGGAPKKIYYYFPQYPSRSP